MNALRGIALTVFVLATTAIAVPDPFIERLSGENSTILHMATVADPGTPPPFDAHDYDAYRRSGTGVIYGTIKVTYADGTVLSCHDEDVSLIPATPYTWWAIRKWAVEINGRHVRDRKMLFPDHLPDYLTPSSASILPTAPCGDDQVGKFVIRNVPAGKYYLVSHVEIRDYQTVTSSNEHMEMQQTPYGEYPVAVRDGSVQLATGVVTFKYGYAVSINGFFDLKEGEVMTYRSDDVVPIAHLLGQR